MIPKMIEVHPIDDAIVAVLAINIEQIESISEGVIKTTSDFCYYVKETYNELSQLINNAGYSVQYTDERLDLKKPLSLSEFQHIVGQPVWDNNLRKWGLVLAYNTKAMICYSDTKVSWIDEEDMKESQFYRMKIQ
jgi:uncharacterized protein YlzI (FlbEa/FlbD family)